jgi:hypothetical protein
MFCHINSHKYLLPRATLIKCCYCSPDPFRWWNKVSHMLCHINSHKYLMPWATCSNAAMVLLTLSDRETKWATFSIFVCIAFMYWVGSGMAVPTKFLLRTVTLCATNNRHLVFVALTLASLPWRHLPLGSTARGQRKKANNRFRAPTQPSRTSLRSLRHLLRRAQTLNLAKWVLRCAKLIWDMSSLVRGRV